MALRVSRRKISAYYADQLIIGNKAVSSQLAAFLVETKRIRELELIVRDIEDALAVRGVVVADVASAHDLTYATRTAIESYLQTTHGAKAIHLRENVDQTLLGGVQITAAGFELDATLRRKLTALKANKV